MEVLEYLIKHAGNHLFTKSAYARYRKVKTPSVCDMVKSGRVKVFKINGAELIYDDQAEYNEMGGLRQVQK